MNCGIQFRNIAASICLASLSNFVYADDSLANLELPDAASSYTRNLARSYSFNPQSPSFNSSPFNSRSDLLAANEDQPIQAQTDAVAAAPEPRPVWMSGKKAHQYLGLGTVVFAGLTALAAPEEGCEHCPPTAQQPPRQTSGTAHTRLARATAAMAVATVVSGLLYHWDDFHWEDGLTDPDNLHVMLAGAGSLLMLYAIDKSAKSTVPTSHAGIAELGAAVMVVAIKLTW